MVVPWAAIQLDRARMLNRAWAAVVSSGAASNLYVTLESDRTKVRAHGLAAGSGGRRRGTAVPGVDARRERALDPERTCSRGKSGAPERRSLGGPPRRRSRRRTRTPLESGPAARTESATPCARGQTCNTCA